MAHESPRSFAKLVVQHLRSAGYDALWAGGCVRDMLRNVRPKDYDIATSAHPQDVKRLFRRTLMVGARFGVAVPATKLAGEPSPCKLRTEDEPRFVTGCLDVRQPWQGFHLVWQPRPIWAFFVFDPPGPAIPGKKWLGCA